MDFDSPDVMKDFPGLYMAEKRKGIDSDYNDESEKTSKKEMIIGRRKEKKDKKDKDKGYAALEGESSDEASPCKTKKSKAFIFAKSKDKEKDHSKDKGECSSKSKYKKKVKLGFGNKLVTDGNSQNIADSLPIFGATLSEACKRGKCHDNIPIPLPVRECIDYVEQLGLNFESIYKVSGNKSKVHVIKKMYNNRQAVALTDYDVPTITSVLKTFLRDLPEPIFTSDLLTRFEEAAAIYNYNIREKHLKCLLNTLPNENRMLISWLIMHFHNIVQRDQVNKMNKQSLAQALNNTLHTSSRLLQALITHRMGLFPDMHIIKYIPPLDAGSLYPEDPALVEEELRKLDSILNLIHWEMQQGFCSSWRQDQLWEVQRVQTDLKRKLKKELSQSHQTILPEEPDEQENRTAIEEHKEVTKENEEIPQPKQNEQPRALETEQNIIPITPIEEPEDDLDNAPIQNNEESDLSSNSSETEGYEPNNQILKRSSAVKGIADLESPSFEDLLEPTPSEKADLEDTSSSHTSVEEEIIPAHQKGDFKLTILRCKNQILKEFIANLSQNIEREYEEIEKYKQRLHILSPYKRCRNVKLPRDFMQVRKLLVCENHMLEIKKVELVRQIVELTERCIDMKAKLMAN